MIKSVKLRLVEGQGPAGPIHADAKARGADCDRCPLRNSKRGPVKSLVTRSNLAAVAESPGNQEVVEKEPMIGTANQMFNAAIYDAGRTREETSIMGAVECQPPQGRSLEFYEKKLARQNKRLDLAWRRSEAGKAALKAYRVALRAWAKNGETGRRPAEPKPKGLVKLPTACCAPRLRQDLAKTGASTILTMGPMALRAVGAAYRVPVGGEKSVPGEVRSAELAAQRGHPLALPAVTWPDAKLRAATLLPTYQPGFARSARHMAHRISADIQRACAIAERKGMIAWRVPPAIIRPTYGQVRRWALAQIKARRRQSIDIETGPRPGKDRSDGLHVHGLIRCIGFSSGPVGHETTIVIPFYLKSGRPYWRPKTEKKVRRLVAAVLERCPFNGHNIYSFDLPRLILAGFVKEERLDRGDLDDTILMHHATREQTNPHDLGYVMSCFLEAPLHKGDVDHKVAHKRHRDRHLWQYNATDCVGTRRCVPGLANWIRQDGTAKTYRLDRDMAFGIITRMNSRPLCVHEESRLEGMAALEPGIHEHREKIRDLLDNPDFNPNSPPQVAHYLFDIKGYEPLIGTDGRPFEEDGADGSTGVNALLALLDSGVLDETDRKFVDHQIEFKGLSKLHSMLKGIEGDDGSRWGKEFREFWVTWKIHVTPSQRFASSPNVQNWPKIGKFNMRTILWAPPGHVWVGADAEQIEARVCAIVTGDEVALEAFERGEDIHALNAATLFAKSESEIPALYDEISRKAGKNPKAGPWVISEGEIATKRLEIGVACTREQAIEKLKADHKEWAEMCRRVAKYFVYLENYGGEEEKLAATLRVQRDKKTNERLFADISDDAVSAWHETYHARRPWVRQWHRRVAQFVARNGFNLDIFALRKRFYPGGPNKKNAPPNHEIQTAATSLINQALIRILRRLPFGCWSADTGFYNHGHDYLGFWVPEARAKEACEIIDDEMNVTIQHGPYKMPFPAKAEVSTNLGKQ